MISIEAYFGGCIQRTIGADVTLGVPFNPLLGRLQVVTASAGSLKVKMPDATKLRRGPGQFLVWNIGANTFSVADNAGTVIAAVATNQLANLDLSANSTAAGTWHADVRAKAT